MPAGKLDQRITFQAATLTPDGAGGTTKGWANVPSVPNVWAKVTYMTGKEGFDDDRDNASTMTKFLVRYRSDISEGDRILWNSETYNIRQILRKGSREMYLGIIAERGVST